MDSYDKITYDEHCFLKEQRDYERYYNTPLEIDGVVFASVADYDYYHRMRDMEEARLQKLTIDLKAFIRQMVRDEQVEKMVASIEQFPVLPK